MTITRLALPFVMLLVSACEPSTGSNPPPTTATRLPLTSTVFLPSPSPTAPPATGTSAPAPLQFREQFEAMPQHWINLQVENGRLAPSPRVEAGFLFFSLPDPNQWVYAFYAPQQYTDVRIDARVEFGADDQGAAGIICRYDELSGWYEFNIHPDGTYMLLLGQWLTEGLARYTPIVRGQSAKIQAAGNEIGLLCEGDILTPFINGVQMPRRQEKIFGLASGKIGIAAASFETAPLSIAYDWVEVSQP